MKFWTKKEIWERGGFTISPLDLGQLSHGLQVTQRMSLPVSICTMKSFGGVPNFTLVIYSLDETVRTEEKGINNNNNNKWEKQTLTIFKAGLSATY